MDIWNQQTVDALCARIDLLTPDTQRLWGKMNVAQMLGHCCVPYVQALGSGTKRAPIYIRIIMVLFYKRSMTNDVPYKQGLPTGRAMIMPPDSMFEANKERLKELIHRFSVKGRPFFEGRRHFGLGPLTSDEWNNVMFKHIDHHLRQFGV